LCGYLNAGVGALYAYDKESETLILNASYAFVQREELSNVFRLGEGTVGQVALQKSPIQLKNIKRTQLTVNTGTTSEAPLNTYTFPLLYQNELLGVIEIGSSVIFDEKMSAFFDGSNLIIATALSSSKSNLQVLKLLEETKIKNQNIEQANVEMEEQQQQLEEANAQMEEQQQLEEANAQMEEQQQQLKEKNVYLEQSQKDLDKRAEDLAMSSKYKSEFLANMSHELRTPLNSIILLSEMLQEDKHEHLDVEEIKKASIIHDSGNELLRLINDVLDLSKVEAGMLDIIVDDFDSTEFVEDLYIQFEHQAIDKNLKLIISDNYGKSIQSDRDRLSQVVRNLISNSLKFTKEGSITLSLDTSPKGELQINVIDTGIGISETKLQTIFEAFQQAEGGTSREYGGTGLGLSISKELIHILGGNISVHSTLNTGSTFTIVIPNLSKDTKKQATPQETISKVLESPVISQAEFNAEEVEGVNDDRDKITGVSKPFLIIEDDVSFAQILHERINDKKEFALIAHTGTEGLKLAKNYDVKGVLLDLGLPDINGIDVLKEFKMNQSLRAIPVYVISGEAKERLTQENGAIGYSQKPLQNSEISDVIEKINIFNEKQVKDLLIVEDDKVQREALIEFIGNGTVKTKGVATKATAIKELDRGIYDGIIIDLGLKDGNGYEICEYISKSPFKIPIIIYTGKSLTKDEELKLRKYTDTIVLKTVSSEKRLLAEVDIFMHRVKVGTKENLSSAQDVDLKGRKILVVDDDIRNIYVLSQALSSKGAQILTAENGKIAIEVLEQNLDTNLILMDVMMPIMDGYEATRLIKSNEKTKNIPIIAVTAKAMDQDKQKTLDVGCSDFIAKPLKMDVLLGIVKGWIE